MGTEPSAGRTDRAVGNPMWRLYAEYGRANALRGAVGVIGTIVRRSIGYVGQDPFLFYGTVKENIAYGTFGASDEEIVEAARTAQAHEFVRNLPDGYDTRIGERGVNISGGQRQRISIERGSRIDAGIGSQRT